MKNVPTITKNFYTLALVLAAAISLSATASSESEEAYDNINVTEQVSAYGAKRLARRFLTDRGFTNGMGPGAARIKSITRDGDTWILQVAFSLDSHIMNERALLYIDAGTARVSEVAPVRKPQQVAAQ
ncbi:MAG: hypothetical protein IIB77_01130 [Proteobacteria bacterium]|nr:hypothetical protein [Pseudomonadota bacterium]